MKLTIILALLLTVTLNLSAQICQVCRTEYGTGEGRHATNRVYCAPADYGEPGYIGCEEQNATVGPGRCLLYDASCNGGPPLMGARTYAPVLVASLDEESVRMYLDADAATPQPSIAESIRSGIVPSNIADIARNFDGTVDRLGFERAVAEVQTAADLTSSETYQLLVWIAYTRTEGLAVPSGPQVAEELRKHHITCSRALRPCSRLFEAGQP